MKKTIYYFLIIFLITGVTVYISTILLPGVFKFVISKELSKNIGANIRMGSLKIESFRKIKIFDIDISKEDSYNISIKQTDLQSNSFLTFFKGTPINCQLSNFKISHKDLAIINQTAAVISIQPLDVLDFKKVDFEIFYKNKQFIFRGLNAEGQMIRIKAYGTIGKNDYINYSLKLFLSKTLTDQIPQKVREMLLKETDDWLEIDLYVSGTAKKPLINLSTEVFKLILH